jgi:hypothetical protein
MTSVETADHVKDVFVDIDGDGDSQICGASTRRRRRGVSGRRRRTHKSRDNDSGGDSVSAVAVDKIDGSVPAPASVSVSVSASQQQQQASIKKPTAVLGATTAQKVVISPPKKKLAKIMLVAKTKVHHAVARPQKTFKAKRVRVTIDNTAKTQKKRRMTLARVDAMTEDQLRETAVATKLSRIETVKKVPVDLLRQMLKDYYTMRGMFL